MAKIKKVIWAKCSTEKDLSFEPIPSFVALFIYEILAKGGDSDAQNKIFMNTCALKVHNSAICWPKLKSYEQNVLWKRTIYEILAKGGDPDVQNLNFIVACALPASIKLACLGLKIKSWSLFVGFLDDMIAC